jgi:hypothetical protein
VQRGQAEKDAISWCVITWDWYKTTGFALRPFANAGAKHGLIALDAGTTTPPQFLDPNGKIGGSGHDGNYVALAAPQKTWQSITLLQRKAGVVLSNGWKLIRQIKCPHHRSPQCAAPDEASRPCGQ